MNGKPQVDGADRRAFAFRRLHRADLDHHGGVIRFGEQVFDGTAPASATLLSAACWPAASRPSARMGGGSLIRVPSDILIPLVISSWKKGFSAVGPPAAKAIRASLQSKNCS